jgi:hypothetical protein
MSGEEFREERCIEENEGKELGRKIKTRVKTKDRLVEKKTGKDLNGKEEGFRREELGKLFIKDGRRI